MLQPLLRKLESGCNEEFVERFLKDSLGDHFGLSAAPRLAKVFTVRVTSWYRELGRP